MARCVVFVQKFKLMARHGIRMLPRMGMAQIVAQNSSCSAIDRIVEWIAHVNFNAWFWNDRCFTRYSVDD